MSQPALNPFIYPGPVPADRFVNREAAVHSLLSRIVTGQNTAVVGQPNIGKSSLLQYLAEGQEPRARLAGRPTQVLSVFQDCHLLPSSSRPSAFWQQVLGHLWRSCPDAQVRQVVDWAGTKREFGSYALERVFRIVTGRRWRVVLLVDEFDSLLDHPGFNTAEFFGALRSLATRFSGLALVTSSRLSVSEMNRHGQELNPYGSPFFNGFIETNLRPFDDDDVDLLLETYLSGTGVAFGEQECSFIRAMAGAQPFLLQAAAGALYDAFVAGKQGRDRYREAVNTFYRQTEDHFSDLWRHLEPRSRTAVAILCLGEVQGRVADQDFDVRDIGSLDRYGVELSRLADQGLVEIWKRDGWQADWKNWVVWHGERWRVTSRRLVWWVSDQVAARDQVDWEEWLGAKQFRGLLTTEEIETLKTWGTKIPKEVTNTASKIAGLLLKELLAAIV